MNLRRQMDAARVETCLYRVARLLRLAGDTNGAAEAATCAALAASFGDEPAPELVPLPVDARPGIRLVAVRGERVA